MRSEEKSISRPPTGNDISATDAKTISQAERRRGRSDAEFCSKLDGLLQEADESQLWLELLREDCSIEGERLEWLLKESNEVLAIFTSIVSKLRRSE
jgi:four helix bundle protein